MVCKSCSAATVGEVVIVCEGFCANTYHAKCVELSIDEKKCCLVNPHIYWICAECSSFLRDIRYSNEMKSEFEKRTKQQHSSQDSSRNENRSASNNVSDDIVEMKQQIENINKTLAELSQLSNSRFCESSLSAVDQPIAHSSPSSPYKLIHGCRKVEARRNITQHVKNADGKFWLFFTRIKNDVTEDEIRVMVTESLGIDDDLVVKKLVPDWKDTSLLPCISFKVGIDVSLRDRAICSSTWPEGICFRQFQEKSSAWEPRHR